MNQRERLIGWIMDSVGGCARHWAEVIADGILERGGLAPPCKVGDTVYAMWCRPSSKKWFVQSSIVIGITFMKYDWFVETDDNDLHLFGSLLNKDWFTDHEAAEQALKEKNRECGM